LRPAPGMGMPRESPMGDCKRMPWREMAQNSQPETSLMMRDC